MVRYTTSTAAEIQPLWDLNPQSHHNLYPTSILICCMPSDQQVVTVYLKQQTGATNIQRLRVVRYTTRTAAEIQPLWDMNPVLLSTSQLVAEMRIMKMEACSTKGFIH